MLKMKNQVSKYVFDMSAMKSPFLLCIHITLHLKNSKQFSSFTALRTDATNMNWVSLLFDGFDAF